MQLKFIQTQSKMKASYQVLQNELLVYNADIPLNFSGQKFSLNKNDHLLYSLSLDRAESMANIIKSTTLDRHFPYNIFDEYGESVGDICSKRTRFFWGYSYFELRLNNHTYTIYEVCCGKQGIKIPIYDGSEQIAIIEKGVTTYDNKDSYEITSKDECSAEIAVLFNVYYDFDKYGNYGEYAYKSKEISYSYTLNKELKSKYNKEFKAKITPGV